MDCRSFDIRSWRNRLVEVQTLLSSRLPFSSSGLLSSSSTLQFLVVVMNIVQGLSQDSAQLRLCQNSLLTFQFFQWRSSSFSPKTESLLFDGFKLWTSQYLNVMSVEQRVASDFRGLFKQKSSKKCDSTSTLWVGTASALEPMDAGSL